MAKTFGEGRHCDICASPLNKFQARFCGTRCRNLQARQTRGSAYSLRGGLANSSTVRCKTCGELLTFTTHDGKLLALDLSSREPHRHQGVA